MGPSNHLLDGAPYPTREGAILGGFIPIEKHCDCLLRSLAISVLHFGPQSASVLISLKAIAGHIGPMIKMHIYPNSRGSTPGTRRLHSALKIASLAAVTFKFYTNSHTASTSILANISHLAAWTFCQNILASCYSFHQNCHINAVILW